MELLLQLGLMFGLGTAIIEAIKLIFPDIPEKTIKIILLVLGAGFGAAWNVNLLAAVGLPPTVNPVLDTVFNIAFMGVFFLIGPGLFYDLLKRAKNEVPEPDQFKDAGEFENIKIREADMEPIYDAE